MPLLQAVVFQQTKRERLHNFDHDRHSLHQDGASLWCIIELLNNEHIFSANPDGKTIST
ncbi:hypothetical protein BN1200_640028 [Klebsiella variicola]|nr:hypothetical protein BN1200_640028 [Klebsiella variicola]